MLDHEAYFIGNVKRFSDYTGYGKTLEFSKAYVDGGKKDIIAIDALCFQKKNMDEQYEESKLIREINKALIGFYLTDNTKHKLISSGKWGCGAFNGHP